MKKILLIGSGMCSIGVIDYLIKRKEVIDILYSLNRLESYYNCHKYSGRRKIVNSEMPRKNQISFIRCYQQSIT